MVTTNIAAASGVLIREVCKSFPVPDAPGTSRLALGGVSFPSALVSWFRGDRRLWKVDVASPHRRIGCSGFGRSACRANRKNSRGPSAERGLVFQDPNLFPWLTVHRNIEAGLVARGVLPKNEMKSANSCRLVQLEAFPNAYPHHLSAASWRDVLRWHGHSLITLKFSCSMNRWARSTPTACDASRVLRLWQNRRTTMLLVTRDIDEAVYMSDRILIMTPAPDRSIARSILISRGHVIALAIGFSAFAAKFSNTCTSPEVPLALQLRKRSWSWSPVAKAQRQLMHPCKKVTKMSLLILQIRLKDNENDNRYESRVFAKRAAQC